MRDHPLHPAKLFAVPDAQRPQAAAEPMRGRWIPYFAAILILYWGWTVALAGPWILSGGMWAEMASNYYPVAHAPSLAAALFTTDAGYIPLPQRLIALSGRGLTARHVPLFYSLSAVLFGGVFVASFCHAIFRPLMPSDAMRFFLCVVFCCIPDFETRTFVNFTYLGIMFTGALVAVSLVPDAEDAPGWAWFAPLLVLSKPVQLTLVPVMLIALLVARPRFRRLWIACLATAMLQVIRLAVSADKGGSPDSGTASSGLVGRFVSAVVNGPAMIGDYSIGARATHLLAMIGLEWAGAILIGLLLTVAFLYAMIRHRAPPGALILTGLSIVYATALLNSFALPTRWNAALGQVMTFETHRSSLSAMVGTIMALFGAVQLILPSMAPAVARRQRIIAACAWFLFAGWPVVALRAAPGSFPMTGASYWQTMAARIDDPVAAACVPADPYVSSQMLFAFQRHCRQLNIGPAIGTSPVIADPRRLLAAPLAARSVLVIGMLVVVAPGNRSSDPVRAAAVTSDGRRFSGARSIGPDGGLLMLMPEGDARAAPVASARLGLSPGVGVVADETGAPALIYLGLDDAGADR